jgi:hypothetical protein
MLRRIKHGSKWGEWTLDAKSLTLDLQSDRHSYQIGLETITDSAQMLDWVFQIRRKRWATNDIVGDLINAFEDIFSPQGCLCGMGVGKTIDSTAFLKERLV